MWTTLVDCNPVVGNCHPDQVSTSLGRAQTPLDAVDRLTSWRKELRTGFGDMFRKENIWGGVLTKGQKTSACLRITFKVCHGCTTHLWWFVYAFFFPSALVLLLHSSRPSKVFSPKSGSSHTSTSEPCSLSFLRSIIITCHPMYVVLMVTLYCLSPATTTRQQLPGEQVIDSLQATIILIWTPSL